MSVEHNLKLVKEKIKNAAKKSGRTQSDVTLIAVTKTFSSDLILEAIRAGQIHFAENYVQEFLPKMEELKNEKIVWHFIGHLQTNKVKLIAGRSDLIHSIDRVSVIDELEKRLSQKQKILIEINLAGEKSKSGAAEADVPKLLDHLQSKKNIELCGLMLMPPIANKPEENRKFFDEIRELQLKWQNLISRPHKLDFLSMGTSHDYELAIESGATHVRLGSVIFGARQN